MVVLKKAEQRQYKTIGEYCVFHQLNKINLWDSFGRVRIISEKIIPGE
jgi:hypothetical protein